MFLIGMKKEKMKKNNNFHEGYMNGGFLFKYYFSVMGTARSMDKLVKLCASDGVTNPAYGTPPTRMGIYKSMWRWALKKENQKEAYNIYTSSELGELFPVIQSWEEWIEFLRSKIESAYQHGGIHEKTRWMRTNGYSV